MKIKIGDFIGKESFPYNLMEVVAIEKNAYTVKLPTQYGKEESDFVSIIDRRKFSQSGLVRLNIIEGEIVKDKIEKPQ